MVAVGGYCGGGGDRFTVGLRRWLGFVLVGGGGAFRFWFWVLFGCLVIFRSEERRVGKECVP